jgi:UDP-GlcNAc:undecaprenyl-phosphate/decaprenyl-phosphate GlcNAc-1-phosphate transferase
VPAYVVVAVVAAVVTAAVTPLVAVLARRVGAIDVPADPRRVHREPVPTMGGLGMLAGVLAALTTAALLPTFRDLFSASSEPLGILVGVLVIALVGVADDLRGLPPSIKLAGQMLAALGPVLFGIQLVYAWIPGLDLVTLSSDLGVPLTVLAMLAMINAVNLIDGLDGLAAGVVAIAAVAFFGFVYVSGGAGIAEATPTSAPLVAAILVGVTAGFLLHNFHPARVFMGDTGSMMLGLLLASAGISYVGRSTAPSYADFAGSVPLLIPGLVLAIPFVDTAFAVARRAYRGQSITVADKGHLHHLLIAFGHSHRRAVLVLWYWSAVLALATVMWSTLAPAELVAGVAVALLVGVLLTAAGVRRGHREHAAEAELDEPVAEVGTR